MYADAKRAAAEQCQHQQRYDQGNEDRNSVAKTAAEAVPTDTHGGARDDVILLSSFQHWKFIYMAPLAITQHLRAPNVFFCTLRFPFWRPNHYVNWLFTIRIKFCLVPADPKNSKKNWKKYVEKFFEKMLKIVKKVESRRFSTFFQLFFQLIFFQLFFEYLGSAGTKQNFFLMVKSQFS